jgi:hypothetical protein
LELGVLFVFASLSLFDSLSRLPSSPELVGLDSEELSFSSLGAALFLQLSSAIAFEYRFSPFRPLEFESLTSLDNKEK